MQRKPDDTLSLTADRIRAMANMGLMYAQDKYDKERYTELLEIAARLAAMESPDVAETILERYRADPYHISPMSGVDAAVMREGRILLIRRHDDRKWAMPGGVLEVGETPAQGCARELFEETGLEGTPDRLLAVFDSRLWGYAIRHHLLSYVFRFTSFHGEPQRTDEAIDVGWFGPDDLPEMSPGHTDTIPIVMRLAAGGPPHFDLP